MESKKSLIIPTVEGNGQTASVWITSSGSFGLSNFDVRDAATEVVINRSSVLGLFVHVIIGEVAVAKQKMMAGMYGFFSLNSRTPITVPRSGARYIFGIASSPAAPRVKKLTDITPEVMAWGERRDLLKSSNWQRELSYQHLTIRPSHVAEISGATGRSSFIVVVAGGGNFVATAQASTLVMGESGIATGAIEAHAGQDGMTCILVRQVSQAN